MAMEEYSQCFQSQSTDELPVQDNFYLTITMLYIFHPYETWVRSTHFFSVSFGDTLTSLLVLRSSVLSILAASLNSCMNKKS
jgi:hypothetical protein